MEIVTTFPGADNFHLFEEIVGSLYSTNEVRYKSRETWSNEWCLICLVVVEERVPLARAALFFNDQLEYEAEKTLQIGLYECVDRSGPASLLFNYTKGYALQHGFSRIVGPINGSTWHSYRLCTGRSNDPPLFFGEGFYRGYYSGQWLENGFESISTYYSALTDNLDVELGDLPELETNLKKVGVRIREIDRDNYFAELKSIHPFVLEAFRDNFLYSPLTQAGFMNLYGQLKDYLEPEFVLIAEDRFRKIVGVYFCIDNFYDSEKKSLIIKTIARSNEPRFRGLGQVMSKMVYDRARASGYSRIIHAFMMKNGSVTNTTRRFLGQPFRNYELYGIKL